MHAAAGHEQRSLGAERSRPTARASAAGSGTGRATCQTRLANSSSGQSWASACTSCGQADRDRAGLAPGRSARASRRAAPRAAARAARPGRRTRDSGRNASLTLTSSPLGSLELLEHRARDARREHVAGQQQHRDAVDRGERGAGEHVGGAGADGRGAGQGLRSGCASGRRRRRRAPCPARCGPGGRAGRAGGPRVCGLEQRLPDAGHVAVAEDPEAARDETLLDAVALAPLVGEEAHDGLRDGEPTLTSPPCRSGAGAGRPAWSSQVPRTQRVVGVVADPPGPLGAGAGHDVEVVEVVAGRRHRRAVPAVRDEDDVAGTDLGAHVDLAAAARGRTRAGSPGAGRPSGPVATSK